MSEKKKTINLIILGNAETGKSNFVSKWIENVFNNIYKRTIVAEFSFKNLEIDKELYKINIWDIEGKEENKHSVKIFNKNNHGCIIICDATRKQTREE